MRNKHKEWDVQQQAVLSLQAPCSASVIGPPGSGKTAVAVALAVRIVQENPEAKIAVLSPDRRAASDLRIHNRLDIRTVCGAARAGATERP